MYVKYFDCDKNFYVCNVFLRRNKKFFLKQSYRILLSRKNFFFLKLNQEKPKHRKFLRY